MRSVVIFPSLHLPYQSISKSTKSHNYFNEFNENNLRGNLIAITSISDGGYVYERHF